MNEKIITTFETTLIWFKLSEKLPPKHTYVLTYNPLSTKCHAIKIKWVFFNIRKEMLCSKSRFYGITHWMKLPELPEFK